MPLTQPGQDPTDGHRSPADPAPYDALLLVSFGGPERAEDVVPFLRNVTKGKDIPDARLEEVGEHYYANGGRSPINDQNRAFLAALRAYPDLAPDANVEAWLVTIAHRKAIDVTRAAARRAALDEDRAQSRGERQRVEC